MTFFLLFVVYDNEEKIFEKIETKKNFSLSIKISDRQKKISFSCVDEITIFYNNKMIDDRLIDFSRSF